MINNDIVPDLDIESYYWEDHLHHKNQRRENRVWINMFYNLELIKILYGMKLMQRQVLACSHLIR